jgi:hypothetical protein
VGQTGTALPCLPAQPTPGRLPPNGDTPATGTGTGPSCASFGTGLVAGLLVAVLVAVLGVGYILINDRNGTNAADDGSVSPSGSTSPTPSPSPHKPKHQGPRPQVATPFSEYGWSKGERLWFGVGKLGNADSGCTVHTYTVNGKTRPAYETDCSSWENDGYDVILFYVALKNPNPQAVPFNLRNFVLASRDGRTFGPVNVRSHAQYPPNFLPETGKVPPKSNLFGWLTFDGRVTGMVPARLNYVDSDQTLTIVFDGKHRAT